MQEHLQVAHEGVKEYTCNDCGKSFGYQRSLYNHIKKSQTGLRITIQDHTERSLPG